MCGCVCVCALIGKTKATIIRTRHKALKLLGDGRVGKVVGNACKYAKPCDQMNFVCNAAIVVFVDYLIL